MLNKNIVFIVCTVVLLFFLEGCTPSSKKDTAHRNSKEITNIYHYNIIITPDLSNRVNMDVHPKPLYDQVIINSLLANIEDILSLGNRETDQKDIYSVSFINKGVIRLYDINQEKLNIDFGKFKNQSDRMDFIKGRKDYKGIGLAHSISQFNQEIDKIYQKAIEKTHGADIWSFFQYEIGDSYIKKDEVPFDFSGKKFQNSFRNILILLTDGYIECGLNKSVSSIENANQFYDLGQSRIDKFRKAYKQSGKDDLKAFFTASGYGIKPIDNNNLANLEVLVIEMYDRSLSRSGNATVHPTDAEILELFWSDWLKKSNVKRFELHRCFSNSKEAEYTLQRFIKNE